QTVLGVPQALEQLPDFIPGPDLDGGGQVSCGNPAQQLAAVQQGVQDHAQQDLVDQPGQQGGCQGEPDQAAAQGIRQRPRQRKHERDGEQGGQEQSQDA